MYVLLKLTLTPIDPGPLCLVPAAFLCNHVQSISCGAGGATDAARCSQLTPFMHGPRMWQLKPIAQPQPQVLLQLQLQLEVRFVAKT